LEVNTESKSSTEMNESDRRGFLNKVITLAASAGLTGLILDRLPERSILLPVQAQNNMIVGMSNGSTSTPATTLTALGGPAAFQATNAGNAAGLQGTCTSGTGVLGTTTTGTGVQGTASSAGATALSGFVSDPGAFPIVAQGASGQTANLQEWRGSSGTPLTVVDSNGNLGVGTSSPARLVHLVGDNAVFRMDRDVDSSAFILVRTAAGDFSTIWKTFYVGVNASGVGNGSFVIEDAGTNVGGAATTRLIITTTGNVGIGTASPDQALSVSGNADKSSGGTSWGTFCDKRWKDLDSIRRFELGLEWVRTLPSPVRFRYAKENGIGANTLEENVNFIAQDLQDGVHDNLVYRTRNKVRTSDKEPVEMFGVNVNDMHFAFVNAIKELAQQNETLREELRLLKSRLDVSEQAAKLAAS